MGLTLSTGGNWKLKTDVFADIIIPASTKPAQHKHPANKFYLKHTDWWS